MHRHRPGADRHPDAAQEGRGRQVRRVLRQTGWPCWAWPTAPPSPTWPRIRRHLRLLPGGRGDPALPAPSGPGDQIRSNWSRSTPGPRACGATPTVPTRCSPTPLNWTWPRSKPVPRRAEAPAGPRVAASVSAKKNFQDFARLPNRRRRPPGKSKAGGVASVPIWWADYGTRPDLSLKNGDGGHRRHHLLHQHLEPVGDDGRRPGGPKKAVEKRPVPQAVGEDLPRSRLQGGLPITC